MDKFEPLSPDFFSDQFQKKNLFFDFEHPNFIASAQCGKHQLVYIIFLGVLLILTVFYCIYELQNAQVELPLPVYLLHWQYLLRIVNSITLFLAAVHQSTVREKMHKTPWHYKVTWVIYTLNLNMSASVQIFTFIANIYGSEFKIRSDRPMLPIYLDRFMAVIDMFITGVPIRILHFYIATLTIFIYGLFNAIYWASGGGVIYAVTDWGSNPGVASSWIFFGAFIIVPLNQLGFFLVYWFRLIVYKYSSDCCECNSDCCKCDSDCCKCNSDCCKCKSEEGDSFRSRVARRLGIT